MSNTEPVYHTLGLYPGRNIRPKMFRWIPKDSRIIACLRRFATNGTEIAQTARDDRLAMIAYGSRQPSALAMIRPGSRKYSPTIMIYTNANWWASGAMHQPRQVSLKYRAAWKEATIFAHRPHDVLVSVHDHPRSTPCVRFSLLGT